MFWVGFGGVCRAQPRGTNGFVALLVLAAIVVCHLAFFRRAQRVMNGSVLLLCFVLLFFLIPLELYC